MSVVRDADGKIDHKSVAFAQHEDSEAVEVLLLSDASYLPSVFYYLLSPVCHLLSAVCYPVQHKSVAVRRTPHRLKCSHGSYISFALLAINHLYIKQGEERGTDRLGLETSTADDETVSESPSEGPSNFEIRRL
jgi:hypothetical protein